MSDERKLPEATTLSGRRVVVCYCGGGPAHEWRPHGGGARILACPPGWPQAAESVVMGLDVLYLAWNRLAYTRVTFPLLLANTDWSLVDRLIVYEDGSTDGTREYLDDILRLGIYWQGIEPSDARQIPASLVYLGYRSPVKTMLHYLNGDPATRFAKIDSDIAVPPGWLTVLSGVMDRSPELELLGMQIGFGGDYWAEGVRPSRLELLETGASYGWLPASHIGGVGLMRSSAFLQREPLAPAGRFGFTNWQQKHDPVRGWLTPDIYCPQMDYLPFPPWPEIAARYVEAGWQRYWPPYDADTTRFWDWIPNLPGLVRG